MSARQEADRLTGHGELHYPGDVAADTVNRVMGPTTLGQWLTCYHAEYDVTADRTVAHMRPSTPTELGGA